MQDLFMEPQDSYICENFRKLSLKTALVLDWLANCSLCKGAEIKVKIQQKFH